MSDQLTRRPRRWARVGLVPGTSIVVPVRALALLLGALAIVLGLAVPRGVGVLTSMSATLGGMVDVNWPRWVHNLADILQIATALFAFLVWGSTLRERAQPGPDGEVSSRRRRRRP